MVGIKGTTSIGMLGLGIVGASMAVGVIVGLSAIAVHHDILRWTVLGSGLGTIVLGSAIGLKIYSRSADIEIMPFLKVKKISKMLLNVDNL